LVDWFGVNIYGESLVKACIITIEYPPVESGVAIACNRIVKAIKNKVEVHVLTFAQERDSLFVNKARTLSTEKQDKVHIHRISPYSGNLTNVPPQEIQNLCYYLEKLDKKHKFDIFHGFNLTGAGYVAAFMAKKLKKKSIVSIRGNDIGRDVYDMNRFYSLKWVLDNADQLTFVAQDLLDHADTITDCRKKSTVILNSLNPFEFYYKDIKLRLDGFVVGFSGVVRRKKGFAYLLEAFSKLVKKHKATLLIVGELMPDEKLSYLKMIEEYRLEDHLIITGRVRHNVVLNYLSLADAFVLPAISEGCSNALLEAMYCKRPCIATKVGAAKDIISHNKSGILIEPHSSEALYRALIKLRSSKRIRTKMGEEAKKTVMSRFSPESESKEWLSLYRKCLK